MDPLNLSDGQGSKVRFESSEGRVAVQIEQGNGAFGVSLCTAVMEPKLVEVVVVWLSEHLRLLKEKT